MFISLATRLLYWLPHGHHRPTSLEASVSCGEATLDTTSTPHHQRAAIPERPFPRLVCWCRSRCTLCGCVCHLQGRRLINNIDELLRRPRLHDIISVTLSLGGTLSAPQLVLPSSTPQAGSEIQRNREAVSDHMLAIRISESEQLLLCSTDKERVQSWDATLRELVTVQHLRREATRRRRNNSGAAASAATLVVSGAVRRAREERAASLVDAQRRSLLCLMDGAVMRSPPLPPSTPFQQSPSYPPCHTLPPRHPCSLCE